MIVEVIPEIKTAKETQSYSYSVPKALEKAINIGSIVYIPFGKKNLRGVVSGFGKSKNLEFKVKNIEKLDRDFVIPENYLELSRWISGYYLCSLGESISLRTLRAEPLVWFQATTLAGKRLA